jgi:hypothetical protein
MSSNQSIEVMLPVGSRVTLLENVDIDEHEGSSGEILFEGYVNRFIPETGLIEFEDSDVGRIEFLSLLDEADSVEIIQEYHDDY